MHHVLAVDLGGSRLRAARVDDGGRVVARVRRPTPAEGGPEVVLAAIVEAVRGLLAAPGAPAPIGLGVAAPGPLDPRRGVVLATPNLPGWDDFPLGERLTDATGLDVWVHNDADLAALGEAHHGAGRGCDPLVYLTVSTGVGGGIVLGGRIFEGRHGLAGELGHVIVRAGGPACNFGHAGCLEGLASGTAIARRAAEALDAGVETAIRAPAAGEPPTAAAVAEAALAGDLVALSLYEGAGDALGLAIGGFVNAFDPARIVIGGGVSRAWPLFERAMWAGVRSVAMVWDARPIHIVPAALGDDAGLVGAATYVAQSRIG